MVDLLMTINSHDTPKSHASFENVIPILQMWDCGPRLGPGPPQRHSAVLQLSQHPNS